MSSTPQIFGLNSGSFIPQADFRAQANEQGRWRASQSFKVLTDSFDYLSQQLKLAPGIPIGSLAPDTANFWRFLVSSGEPEVGAEVAGFTLVTINFIGFWSATYDGTTNTERPKTYAMSGNLEETTIMDHPKIVALTGEERGALAAIFNGDNVWDVGESKAGFNDPETGAFTPFLEQLITTGDAVIFANKIAEGRSSYKRPTITWTKYEEDDNPLSTSSINNLGHIDSPDGSPPTPNGGRDWMLISADSTQHGTTDEIWSNQLVWLLSERGGWDSDIYDT